MPNHSEEIEDILEQIPSKILRIGISIILIIFVGLVIGAYVYKYPVLVTCPVYLITINPPEELRSKVDGQIECFFVDNNQSVESEQPVALLKNVADFGDITKLDEIISTIPAIPNWDSIVQKINLPIDVNLGELQASYNEFYSEWNNCKHYLQQGYIQQKLDNLYKQIKKQNEYLYYVENQRKIQEESYNLSLSQYKRDSSFYCKFKDVAVSAVQREQQIQSFLSQKSSYANYCATVKAMEQEILKLNESSLDLITQNENALHEFYLKLNNALKGVEESLNKWKANYLIKASIKGVVSFTGFWKEKQIAYKDDLIATIVPPEKFDIIGRAFVDMNGIGRVKQGQQVNIKLNGFPYMEYGLIKGIVQNVSMVPNSDKKYVIMIQLSEGMKSSYQGKLKFIQEMDGVAEITTKKERLLTHILAPIKSILKN